ncbi:hypothetical protein NL676_026582 [Syzygium grande]|nr:hypothetical protein NL676_026582 [Syzygium grande]
MLNRFWDYAESLSAAKFAPTSTSPDRKGLLFLQIWVTPNSSSPDLCLSFLGFGLACDLLEETSASIFWKCSQRLHISTFSEEISARKEQPKEKTPTMSSVAMPYTGGDIKKSGELGKMFDITDGSKSRKSGPITGAPSRTGSFGGAASHSGPIMHNVSSRASYTTSGPVTSGLITSGPISSGPLNSSGAPRKVSGPLDSVGSVKLQSSVAHLQSVTTLSQEDESSFMRTLPKSIMWSVILIFVMGFIAGGFILGAVHNPILLIVVVVLFALVATMFTWNTCWARKAITGYIAQYPDSDLRTAKNGQYVKVSGVITCEVGILRQPILHIVVTWGLRSAERHVVDFYISDFQSGLRALVKTGYGARVTPYVDDSSVIDINPSNKDMSREFLRWLGERNLSCDDRMMRLKEGYIKEGSTVSVMGIVQRNDNMVMIVPPPEPFTTGCQWSQFIFPATLDGIVLRCEDTSKIDCGGVVDEISVPSLRLHPFPLSLIPPPPSSFDDTRRPLSSSSSFAGVLLILELLLICSIYFGFFVGSLDRLDGF